MKGMKVNNQIRILGAKQHNLKNLDIEIPLGQVTVITGVSGSGKSSLSFNTLYAEGQRRYIESFSAYARQFMDRMNKPDVDKVEGILPAIAIDQADRVRSSRSTVGTMTGLADYLKLLFAKHGQLFCRGCDRPIEIENPEFILNTILEKYPNTELMIAFPVNWDMYEEEEGRYGFAEKQRLEYVAATRARDYLIVSTYTKGEAEKSWHCMYSNLKESLKTDIKELQEE